MTGWIRELLGAEADSLLKYECKGIPKQTPAPARARLRRPHLHPQRPQPARPQQPRPAARHRPARAAPATSRSCRSTRASSTRRPPPSRPTRSTSIPENIVKLAIEGGCNARGLDLRRPGHRGPQVRPQDPVHREDQPQRAADLPQQATTRSCSARSSRPSRWARPPSAPRSTSAATKSHRADRRGRRGLRAGPRAGHGHDPVVLPAQQRASRPTRSTTTAPADLTGQANHLGVTIQADIIKQKLPTNNGGYKALKFGKTSPAGLRQADQRQPDRPVPLPGGQLLHGPHRPDQLRRRVEGRRATWPRPSAPPSSTSAPAAWA